MILGEPLLSLRPQFLFKMKTWGQEELASFSHSFNKHLLLTIVWTVRVKPRSQTLYRNLI